MKNDVDVDVDLEVQKNINESRKPRIVYSDLKMINIDLLERHPENRPCGINREAIDQLKEIIKNDGFRGSILVRPVNSHFQIISGEHRFIAYKELGYTEMPCDVMEMDDSEAMLQLIINNIQTELKPLEIGLNALKVVKKDSKKGYSAAAYGERIGINNRQVINEYIAAAEVYSFVKEQCPSGLTLLQEIKKLIEIHKTDQSNWLFLHNFVVENELQKDDTIKLCRLIREIDDSIEYDFIKEIFNMERIKKDIGTEFLKEKDKIKRSTIKLIKIIQEFYVKLEENKILYFYDIEKDEIVDEKIDLKNRFINMLNEIEHDALNESTVNSKIKNLINYIMAHEKERAENTANYYRDKENQQQLEEQLRIEKEQKETIKDLWLGSCSINEIAKKLKYELSYVEKTINEYKKDIELNLKDYLYEWYLDSDDPGYNRMKPFLYNILELKELDPEEKKKKEGFFGPCPQIFMENLLWHHTNLWDLVYDPFAGSGTTIDACQRMFRRYYCSDRKVLPGREKDIKEWDILQGLPEDLPKPDLAFLDPPYCQQARGKYSDSENDLGNMSLEKFYETMFQIFGWLAEKKVKKIAFVICPSQWGMEGKRYEPHDFYFAKKLDELGYRMIMRYVLPYSSEQYCAAQVIKAKELRIALNLDRTMQVWEMR